MSPALPIPMPTASADHAAGSAKISVERLSAYFRAARVLRDVSLEIPAFSVTAIIGPSGCGKSTFLRCLNRMHELTPGARVDGRIRLDGEDLQGGDIDPVLLLLVGALNLVARFAARSRLEGMR